jgi:hypothetical protein
LDIASPTASRPPSSSPPPTPSYSIAETDDDDPRSPEEIEAHITRLLTSSGLRPDDPVLRRQAAEVIAEDPPHEDLGDDPDDELGPDDPIDVDGNRYYERRVRAQDDDDTLPSPGL